MSLKICMHQDFCKHKKTCYVIERNLKKERMPPGTLFEVKRSTTKIMPYPHVIKNKVVTERVTIDNEVKLNDVIMLLDVVYDPIWKQPILRFLKDDKIVGLPFEKGKTFGDLRSNKFRKISNTKTSDDKTQ